MSFITKAAKDLLNISPLMESIKPCSELGRNLKKDSTPYRKGNETELRLEYAKISVLMNAVSNSKSLLLTLTAYLAKVENITNLILNLPETCDEEQIKPLHNDELHSIKHFLFYFEKIRELLKQNELSKINEDISLLSLLSRLDADELDTPLFSLSNRYSSKLAKLRAERLSLYYKKNKLEKENLNRAKEEMGLTSLEKQTVISRADKDLIAKFNNSGWFTITNENFANITYSLRNSEEIVRLLEKEHLLHSEIEEEEYLIRKELTSEITLKRQEILESLKEMAKLDYLTARAHFGIENNCIIPTIQEHSKVNPDEETVPTLLYFADAVNLQTKKMLQEQNIEYQPVTVRFQNRINLLTGTNMSGKSTLLETIGQLLYLTSYAVPLPCSEAIVSLTDFIYCNRSSEARKRTDLSSFAAEMVSLNDTVNITGKGVFLIDEFAAGTNPQEGEAFSLALMEFFAYTKNPHRQEDIVIAATHFSSPSLLDKAAHFRIAGILPEDYEKIKSSLQSGIVNNQLPLRLAALHKYMNYQPEQVVLNNTPPQAAIMIAEILGVNEEIIAGAKKRLASDNSNRRVTE